MKRCTSPCNSISIPPQIMALSCPIVQLTETFLPPILLNVSDYSHTLRGENMAGATRQKILDAAEKLLLLKGLARVTTKEIARETGLSEGALYRHFDHKEEIFFALMARHLPAFHEAFQAHQAGTGTPSEKDRKSTRLNSSHPSISYAVFCL